MSLQLIDEIELGGRTILLDWSKDDLPDILAKSSTIYSFKAERQNGNPVAEAQFYHRSSIENDAYLFEVLGVKTPHIRLYELDVNLDLDISVDLFKEILIKNNLKYVFAYCKSISDSPMNPKVNRLIAKRLKDAGFVKTFPKSNKADSIRYWHYHIENKDYIEAPIIQDSTKLKLIDKIDWLGKPKNIDWSKDSLQSDNWKESDFVYKFLVDDFFHGCTFRHRLEFTHSGLIEKFGHGLSYLNILELDVIEADINIDVLKQVVLKNDIRFIFANVSRLTDGYAEEMVIDELRANGFVRTFPDEPKGDSYKYLLYHYDTQSKPSSKTSKKAKTDSSSLHQQLIQDYHLNATALPIPMQEAMQAYNQLAGEVAALPNPPQAVKINKAGLDETKLNNLNEFLAKKIKTYSTEKFGEMTLAEALEPHKQKFFWKAKKQLMGLPTYQFGYGPDEYVSVPTIAYDSVTLPDKSDYTGNYQPSLVAGFSVSPHAQLEQVDKNLVFSILDFLRGQSDLKPFLHIEFDKGGLYEQFSLLFGSEVFLDVPFAELVVEETVYTMGANLLDSGAVVINLMKIAKDKEVEYFAVQVNIEEKTVEPLSYRGADDFILYKYDKKNGELVLRPADEKQLNTKIEKWLDALLQGALLENIKKIAFELTF